MYVFGVDNKNSTEKRRRVASAQYCQNKIITNAVMHIVPKKKKKDTKV